MNLNPTYRSQNQCNCSDRNRFEHISVLNTFIPLVLEPHNIDGLLNDWMLVHPFAFRLLCLRIDVNRLNIVTIK